MIANRHCDGAAVAWHRPIACLILLAGLSGCAPSGQTSTESQSAASSLQSASAASSSSEVVAASAVVATSSVATSAESSSASSAEKTVTAPASSDLTKTSGKSRTVTSSSQAAAPEKHEVASAPEIPANTSQPVSSTTSSTASESSPASATAAPAPQPSLDLDSLEQRLRDTKAIGLFTKLSLKNQVDDLLNAFRAHYSGKSNIPLSDLRQRYDLLLMKILTLLQDSDTSLAADVRSSREAIWDILKDPKKFAEIS